MSTNYSWQALYEEAVLETDDASLREKLDAAQSAINTRLVELASDGVDAGPERKAIRDALKGLSILREERQCSH